MLKGARGPLLALLSAVALLGAVLVSRPSAPPPGPATTTPAAFAPSREPVTETPPTAPLPPTETRVPTLPIATPFPYDPQTLREGLVDPNCVIKINPLLAGFNQPDRDVSALIFEGLMRTDQYGAAVPALAAGLPRISADGLTYVIALRTDVLWHDGVPFSSADVAFTFGLLQDPSFTGPVDLAAFWRSVEIDALDGATVRFKLAQPLATFVDYLRIGLLPEHALQGANGTLLNAHPFNLSPVGTGPYQFENLLSDGQRVRGVQLRAAATYAARPEAAGGYALRRLIFQCYPTYADALAAYQRGEISSIGEVPPNESVGLKTLGLTLYSAYRPALGTVIFNYARNEVSFFHDIRLRAALARTLDRRALIDASLADRAVAANGPVLPSSWAYNPAATCPAYDPADPEAAARALAQVQATPPPPSTPENPETPAPDPAQSGGDTYRFQLLVTNDAGLAALAQLVVERWNTLGKIRAEVVVVDGATFRERLTAGNFDVALVELNLAPAADPDPYSLWRQTPRDGGLNFGSLSDRAISELIESARAATNGADRAKRYADFQDLFCDRVAALPLFYPVYYYAADARLSGVQLGFMAEPSERFRTVREWRFPTP